MKTKLKPFSYLKLVTLFTAFSLLIFQYSCKKQQNTSTSSNNNGSVDISQLRPEMKVQMSEVFNWIYSNVPVAHQGSLQLNHIQQRFIDNHHVIKIPIQDDAALFFTKDSAKLKVYAYKWDDKNPGTKLYTGHIVSFSFQDFSVRAMKYYEGKKIKDGTLKGGNSFLFSDKGVTVGNSIATHGFLATSGEERIHTMSLLGDIWCIISGGTLYSRVGTTGNGCDYDNGWGADVMSFLANLFGSSNSDSSSYGNNSSSPVGVWYGSGAYTGPSPNEGGGGGNGTSPASQPYQGGPIWVSQWVDATNPAYCTTTDENGNMMFVPGGCASGYWQSVQISDEDDTPIDYNNLVEVNASSESFNDADESNVLPSDGITYAEYQSVDGWPNVLSIMPATTFVKYNNDPTACFRLAKEQIGKLGYTVSGWSTTNGLIFTTYNENNSPQVNLSQTKVAITYINQALQQGIPILIGVDYASTRNNKNLDNTTTIM